MSDPYASYPSLRNKIVVITGGASGIGRAFVEHFQAQGARVFFLDVDKKAATSLVSKFETDRRQPLPVFKWCDLTDIEALQNALEEIAAKAGGVDVLVNNAGNDQRHTLDEVSSKSWDASMAINLKHYFFATQAVYKHMSGREGGSIICIGSISWLNNTTGMICYTTAKAAMHGLVRTLARQLGPHNIRVNGLLPGWVMTKRQEELWVDETAEAEIKREQCLADKLSPDDIARMALFLAADDSAMCTQQCYIVDGGWV